MKAQEEAERLQRLNVGCGSRWHDAWVNVDLMPRSPSVRRMDLRAGLSFEGEQFEVVYHSHVLEHLDATEGCVFLRECYRVLKPGGILRCVVPDLEGITRVYLQQLEEASQGCPEANERHEWMIIELVDQLARHHPGGRAFAMLTSASPTLRDFVVQRWGTEAETLIQAVTTSERGTDSALRCSTFKRWISKVLRFLRQRDTARDVGCYRLGGEPHRWMYDRVSLGRVLKQCGFEDIAVVDAVTSGIAGWRRFELDASYDGRVYKPDSLFMEARKPGLPRPL